MKNEREKYYIPVLKNPNAPKGYIVHHSDYEYMEVSKEVYLAFHRPIWVTWKEKKKLGCCSGCDWKCCMGDCCDCPHYHRGSEVLSLDAPFGDDEFTTLGDTIEDPDSCIDEILTQSTVLEELLNALQEIDPDGRRIGELLSEGKSGHEVCDILGMAHTTYLRRFKKMQEALKTRLKK